MVSMLKRAGKAGARRDAFVTAQERRGENAQRDSVDWRWNDQQPPWGKAVPNSLVDALETRGLTRGYARPSTK